MFTGRLRSEIPSALVSRFLVVSNCRLGLVYSVCINLSNFIT